MFCNYCGTHNSDVAKFCRKCGKPIVNSNQPSTPPLPVAEAPSLIDPPANTATAVDSETIHSPQVPVATIPLAAPETYAGKTHVVRATKRNTIASVAGSIAVLLVVAVVFSHVYGNRPRTLTGHSNFISSIAFSPDSRTLASGSSDGTVKLWGAASGRWLRTLSSYQSTDRVAFSPDGHALASSGELGHELGLWDVASGNERRVSLSGANSAGQPAFSPDGHLLVASAGTQGSGDGGILMWDAVTLNEVRRFPGAFAEPIFSPDGKLLAVWNKNRSISLLDVESGNELRTLGGDAFVHAWQRSFIFSPDGHLLATTNGTAVITLWDVASGQQVRNINDSATVRGIAFSPDGRLLASGSEDHTIKLWDLSSGNTLRTFTGNSDSVNCVAFSLDGRWLASGGADANVRIWSLPKPQ